MKRMIALIVAGGSGQRMGAEIPKQFLLLNGLPVLMHTIKRFIEFNKNMEIILVLPENEISRWESLQKEFAFEIPHTIVTGGSTRFHSVKNGLAYVNGDATIAVHDGVRPLCSSILIKRCFDEAASHANAIPAIVSSDTVREIVGSKNSQVDRERIRLIQTPQCFDAVLLKKAYENAQAEKFTDDAGVFEADGNTIHLVEGEKKNIKITEKTDLVIASALIDEFFPG